MTSGPVHAPADVLTASCPPAASLHPAPCVSTGPPGAPTASLHLRLGSCTPRLDNPPLGSCTPRPDNPPLGSRAPRLEDAPNVKPRRGGGGGGDRSPSSAHSPIPPRPRSAGLLAGATCGTAATPAAPPQSDGTAPAGEHSADSAHGDPATLLGDTTQPLPSSSGVGVTTATARPPLPGTTRGADVAAAPASSASQALSSHTSCLRSSARGRSSGRGRSAAAMKARAADDTCRGNSIAWPPSTPSPRPLPPRSPAVSGVWCGSGACGVVPVMSSNASTPIDHTSALRPYAR
eukprot:170957-Chlamydomonas_euryale.AAC.3